jgi:hypothetical protein
MGQNASAEAIIAVASQLKDQVTGLHQAYVRLPQVIEDEHAAIKAGRIAAVEQTAEAKAQLGAQIEACFGAMRKASDELKAWRARLLGGPERPVVTLRDCVAALEELAASLDGAAFGVQVLKHQTQGLKQLVAEFDGQFKRVQPLIEMNKYVTERMLANHQESYQFWISLVEETESAYNAQGVQKAQGRRSAFKVTGRGLDAQSVPYIRHRRRVPPCHPARRRHGGP